MLPVIGHLQTGFANPIAEFKTGGGWLGVSTESRKQCHYQALSQTPSAHPGAEFEVVEAGLEDQMARQYAAAASMWNQLRREFLYAAEQAGVAERDAGLPKKRGSLLWRSFWASHQRFFRHMCMAAKVSFHCCCCCSCMLLCNGLKLAVVMLLNTVSGYHGICMAAKVTSGHCSTLSKARQSKCCEWNVEHSYTMHLLA